MATTVGSFSDIDDSEVDAESPMTESLWKRARDNAYWIVAGKTLTTENDSTKVLKPDGSGGVTWGDPGGNGTKGILSTITTTWTTLTTLTSGIMIFDYNQFAGGDGEFRGSAKINLSDDTFVSSLDGVLSGGSGRNSSYSGTITTASNFGEVANTSASAVDLQFRRDSENFQIRLSSGTVASFHANWIVI